MEFYKLPNKFGDYGLDYCTELKGWNYKIAFVYKGKEGSYHEGKIKFGDKEYPADRHYINSHSNTFTEEDIPMLVAMARSFFVRQFPFRTEDWDVVCLSIDDEWLSSLGITILKIDNYAKCYAFKDGNLYIDNKPIDILNLCRLYKLEDGTYGYGLQPLKDEDTRIVVSDNLIFGCKVGYLQEMLPYLPLRDKFGHIELSKGVTLIDKELHTLGSLSKVPKFKVTKYEETSDSIDYEVVDIN